MMILEAIMDKKLYKYRCWNNNTKNILINNELYYQSPENFNDPYDVNMFVGMHSSIEEWINEYFKWRMRLSGKVSFDEFSLICSSWYCLSPELKTKFEKVIARGVTKMVRRTSGIYCFSANNNNILMWSHYADKHKGVCLEFDHSNISLLPAYKVKYCKDYPIVNFFKALPYELNKIRFFTKSRNWKYEEEYRIVISNFANKIKKFQPQILTGVICGCSMTNENIKELVEIIKTRKTPITLYKAKTRQKKFGLTIEPIEQCGKET